MDYFKHKTLSTFIWIAVFAWPFLHQTLSAPNHAILSFILYMADFVTFFNKNRMMVYSEYKLVKGQDPVQADDSSLAYIYTCLSYYWPDDRLDRYVRHSHIFSTVWLYTTRAYVIVIHIDAPRYISRWHL